MVLSLASLSLSSLFFAYVFFCLFHFIFISIGANASQTSHTFEMANKWNNVPNNRNNEVICMLCVRLFSDSLPSSTGVSARTDQHQLFISTPRAYKGETTLWNVNITIRKKNTQSISIRQFFFSIGFFRFLLHFLF